jgi:hypothetical protein
MTMSSDMTGGNITGGNMTMGALSADLWESSSLELLVNRYTYFPTD